MSAHFLVISDPVVFQNAQVTIYRAQKVVTMNPQMPWAECVAVAGGTIIAVGDFIDMEAYFKAHAASYQINDTFINNVIYPGFIEAHMHAQQSGLYNMNYVYIGYFDRHTADGEISRGCKTPDEIIAKLREVIEKNPGKYNDQNWLSTYGIDPLILGDAKLENINSKWLDQVSSTVPICLNHASGHLMTVNTRAIELSGIDAVHDDNIGRYPDGSCNGNVAEPDCDGTQEWNAFWDPEAVSAVFSSSIKITMVALESTHNVPLTPAVRMSWAKDRRYPGIDFIGNSYAFVPELSMFETNSTYFLWDVLTTCALEDPTLIKQKTVKCSVYTDFPRDGRTYLDDNGREAQLVYDVDNKRFFDMIKELGKKTK